MKTTTMTNNMLPILFTFLLLHMGNPSPNISGQPNLDYYDKQLKIIKDSTINFKNQHFLDLYLIRQTQKKKP